MLKKFLMAIVVIATVASIAMAGCLTSTQPQPLATTNSTMNATKNATTATNANQPTSTMPNGRGQPNSVPASGTSKTPASIPTQASGSKAQTSIIMSLPSGEIHQGDSVTLTFQVVYGVGTPIPGAYVVFDVRGTNIGASATGDSGWGTFTFSTAGYSTGTLVVNANYGGNAQYASSWGTIGGWIYPATVAPIAPTPQQSTPTPTATP
jgi:hypothetical protein